MGCTSGDHERGLLASLCRHCLPKIFCVSDLQREVVKMKFVGKSDDEDVVNCERGVSRTLSLCLSHLIKVARVRKHKVFSNIWEGRDPHIFLCPSGYG